jgi:hypothetical protein
LETDFEAQSRAGKMLCSNPEMASKTCSTIATYKFLEKGEFVQTAELVLSIDPPITLEMTASGDVVGGATCGTIELSDMQQGKLRINGSLLAPVQNEEAIGKIVEKLAPMAGRRTCEALRMEADQLMKYGQVDGIDVNLPGKPVRWISSDEGYRVAPR